MSVAKDTNVAPRLLKIVEARTQLSVSESQIYRLVAAGQLELKKIGTASRITQSSVDKLIQSLPAATLNRKPQEAIRHAAA